MTTTADTPEPDLSRALGAAFDAAGSGTLRVLRSQPAAFGGWMIHGDGSHALPGPGRRSGYVLTPAYGYPSAARKRIPSTRPPPSNTSAA